VKRARSVMRMIIILVPILNEEDDARCNNLFTHCLLM
jgi:hypothetical protein